MAVDVNIKIQDDGVNAALDRLRMALPLGGQMRPVMDSLGRVLKTGVQMRFRTQKDPEGTPWKPTRRGGQILSLSRVLRNSLTYKATSDTAEVGTNVVYAAIHQFGGVIRAKNGPFLAIPVTDAARKWGSPRKAVGVELAVSQSLKGQFMLVDSKTGTVHFLLRKQVTVPARPFLGASESDRQELLRVMQGHLDRAWGRQ